MTTGKTVTFEEAKRLLGVAAEHDEMVRSMGKPMGLTRYSDARARIAALYFLGARQGEAAALGWDYLIEVATESRKCMVARIHRCAREGWRDRHPEWSRPLDRVKWNALRDVRVHETGRTILCEHRDYLKALDLYRPDGPVFPEPSGAGPRWQWRNEQVMRASFLRVLGRRAGIEGLTVHALRRAFPGKLLGSGLATVEGGAA